MISEEKIQKALNESYYNIGPNAYYGNGFIKGVEFAESEYKELKAQRNEILEVLKRAQAELELISNSDLSNEIEETINKIKGE